MTLTDLEQKEKQDELCWDIPDPRDKAVPPQQCPDCHRAGRGKVMAIFKGHARMKQTVMVDVLEGDEFVPRDRRAWVPFAVWACEHGHVMTDGY